MTDTQTEGKTDSETQRKDTPYETEAERESSLATQLTVTECLLCCGDTVKTEGMKTVNRTKVREGDSKDQSLKIETCLG